MEFSFGDYLKQTILLSNLSQRQAAKLLHISPQAFHNYIANKRIPDMKTMAHIMQFFHMDANRVFHIQHHHDICQLSEDEIALIQKYRILKTQYQAMVQHFTQDLIQDERNVKKAVKRKKPWERCVKNSVISIRKNAKI